MSTRDHLGLKTLPWDEDEGKAGCSRSDPGLTATSSWKPALSMVSSNQLPTQSPVALGATFGDNHPINFTKD
ncbi:Hypothetical predicted protein [Cloeon dipterum]|uniref:Uncharacterized protein n=1 Tax=Cloeon dipterum TaxID=197152 RepID=A0A8S1BWE1_9INSE|nr:Hypothetical predicted protein [Cloeon dipterum]